MKEISNDEVVRAYELCYVGGEGDCSICPLVDENGRCTDDEGELLGKVLGILKSQKGKVKALESIEHFADKLIEAQRAEIERYKGVIKLLERDVQTSKTEAIKEFAEIVYRFFCKTQVWKTFKSAVLLNGECDWLKGQLDNLVKEMTEEQND